MFTIPQHWLKVSICWLMLAFLEMGYWFGWTIIHTLLVKRAGPEYLPFTYIALNCFTVAGSIVYVKFVDKVSREKVLNYFILLSVVLLLMARLLFSSLFINESVQPWQENLYFILILFVQAFCGFTLPMQIWTMINDVLQPSQAKSLYPILNTAWIIGGAFAGILIQLLIMLDIIKYLIIVWALFLASVIYLNRVFYKKYAHEMVWNPTKYLHEYKKKSHLKELFDYLKQNHAIKFVIVIMFLYSIVVGFQDLQFTKIMNLNFPTETTLANFYGQYSVFWSVSALFLQFFLVKKILFRFGVFRSLFILPFVMCISFMLIALNPFFWTALFLRYCWDVISSGIQYNASELTYNMVPTQIRGRVRGFCDGIVMGIGGIIGGLFLIVIQNVEVGSFSNMTSISLIGFIVCLIWLGTAIYGRRSYVQALVNNLKTKDRSTLLNSLESLEEPREPLAYKTLLSILCSDTKLYDYQVKGKVMEVLARLGNVNAIRQISQFLDHPEEYLRFNAVKAVGSFKHIHRYPIAFYYVYAEMLHIFEHDSIGRIRLEAGRFIITHYNKKELPKYINELLHHQDPYTKMSVLKSLPSLHLDHVDLLMLKLLDDPNPLVRGEVIVNLSYFADYQDLLKDAITNLLHSQNASDKKIGLETLLRIQSSGNFLPQIQKLLSESNLFIRAFAALVYLSLSQSTDREWSPTMKIFLEILADSHFDEKYREELFSYVHYLRDNVIDALFQEIQKLPPHKRDVVQKGMDKIANTLYSKIFIDF